MDKIIVELTWGEVYRAGEVALQRRINNLRVGRPNAHGAERQEGFGLGLDIEWLGCLGEMATAKHFNFYWRATDFGVVDVGEKFEVRSTSWPTGRLIGYDKDRDDIPFILAHVLALELPKVFLMGYLMGRDMKQPQWFGPPNPAKPNGREGYFVPNEALLPVRELYF